MPKGNQCQPLLQHNGGVSWLCQLSEIWIKPESRPRRALGRPINCGAPEVQGLGWKVAQWLKTSSKTLRRLLTSQTPRVPEGPRAEVKQRHPCGCTAGPADLTAPTRRSCTSHMVVLNHCTMKIIGTHFSEAREWFDKFNNEVQQHSRVRETKGCSP